MKKSIFALILGVCLLPACTSDITPTEANPITVTFTIGTVESGPITKGAVDNLISATAPTGQVQLRLTSTTDNSRQYTTTPGAYVDIIPDTYRVTAQYIPTSTFDCFRGKFYLEPRFSINTEVLVREGIEAYALVVSWDCFALVMDRTKVDHYTVTNSSIVQAEPTQWNTDQSGELSLVYVHCSSDWEGDMFFRVTAIPVEHSGYNTTSWNLVTKPTNGCLQVRNGYWYCFTPDGTATQSGVFSFNYPSWMEGSTII